MLVAMPEIRTSAAWSKHIYETKVLPITKLGGLCAFFCNQTSSCEMFVIDGANCHMGNHNTTNGSVTPVDPVGGSIDFFTHSPPISFHDLCNLCPCSYFKRKWHLWYKKWYFSTYGDFTLVLADHISLLVPPPTGHSWWKILPGLSWIQWVKKVITFCLRRSRQV